MTKYNIIMNIDHNSGICLFVCFYFFWKLIIQIYRYSQPLSSKKKNSFTCEWDRKENWCKLWTLENQIQHKQSAPRDQSGKKPWLVPTLTKISSQRKSYILLVQLLFLVITFRSRPLRPFPSTITCTICVIWVFSDNLL